jgi:V/A-type H+-transporting ATPase subunit K
MQLEVQRKPTWKRNLLLLTPFLVALVVFSFTVATTFAQGPTQTQTTQTTQTTGGFDIVGAGLAVGLCGIGAGLAIYGSTSAGLAAMVERPELTTWVLVFAGLGEGIAIYGLVVAILILGRH